MALLDAANKQANETKNKTLQSNCEQIRANIKALIQAGTLRAEDNFANLRKDVVQVCDHSISFFSFKFS
jgi:hypothetical protein